MPVTQEEVDMATRRLWESVPLGYGKDLNTLLKYIDYLKLRLNGDLTSE